MSSHTQDFKNQSNFSSEIGDYVLTLNEILE